MGKKVIFLINTLGLNWNKKKKSFIFFFEFFFFACRISDDVRLLDLGFGEQIFLGKIYVF